MGANANQFLMLREQQLFPLYDASFTKKEAQATGANLTLKVLEEGNIDKLEYIANLARAVEVLSSAMTEARKFMPLEKVTHMGVTFTPVNGGNTIIYEQDAVYADLKKALDERVELLKLAQKQFTLDGGGNVVPKCGTKPRSSSTTITF